MTSFIPAQELLALAGDHLWQSTLFAAASGALAMLLKRHSAALPVSRGQSALCGGGTVRGGRGTRTDRIRRLPSTRRAKPG